jgi:hypothetical protein
VKTGGGVAQLWTSRAAHLRGPRAASASSPDDRPAVVVVLNIKAMESDRLIEPEHHRFRTQTVATVIATLASSIESTIESLVSRLVADNMDRSSDAQAKKAN